MSGASDAQDKKANVCVSLQQAGAYEKPVAKGEPMPAPAKTGTAAADGAPAAPAATDAAPKATPHSAQPALLSNPGADSKV